MYKNYRQNNRIVTKRMRRKRWKSLSKEEKRGLVMRASIVSLLLAVVVFLGIYYHPSVAEARRIAKGQQALQGQLCSDSIYFSEATLIDKMVAGEMPGVEVGSLLGNQKGGTAIGLNVQDLSQEEIEMYSAILEGHGWIPIGTTDHPHVIPFGFVGGWKNACTITKEGG